jgi:hypothetical protein
MKPLLYTLSLAFICLMLTSACNNNSKENNNNTESTVPSTIKKGNKLSFKMDGVLWEADNKIVGIYHPKGYNNAVMIGGSKGPENKDEQVFTLNLYGAEKEGEYNIKTNDPNNSVVQLANLSNDEPMCGSLMGYNFNVSLKKGTGFPTVIEASFEGELTCNSDRKIKITEGVFSYQE